VTTMNRSRGEDQNQYLETAHEWVMFQRAWRSHETFPRQKASDPHCWGSRWQSKVCCRSAHQADSPCADLKAEALECGRSCCTAIPFTKTVGASTSARPA
jgi:hypothetical protein